ncbi:MAG TPA: hypothetical protein VIN00_05585 [Candidatus Dormibacteraeota bacterium]
MGSKASYYPPQVMKAPLDYCGSDGLSASVESGLDGINHVVVAAAVYSPYLIASKTVPHFRQRYWRVIACVPNSEMTSALRSWQ